jgi:broad specificity phosphatase PhoE
MSTATRILVLRHGQSEWNARGKWQGQADIDLTDLGCEQARRAADKLGTFDALGLGLLEADPRLRETHVGEWEGLTHDDIEKAWPGYLKDHRRPPGFESDESIVARVSASLHDLAATFPGGSLLCIAHAGVLRVTRRHLGVHDTRIANLGGCEFTVRAGSGGALDITTGDIVDLFEHGEIGEEL